jgi:hypothetical protein
MCAVSTHEKDKPNKEIQVGFEVLTAVVMNVAIFWDIEQCSPHVS